MENLQNIAGLEPINTGFNPLGPLPTTKSNKSGKDEFNEPSNLSGWELIGKTFTGLVIGGVIAALLFIVMSFVGGMFTSALSQNSGEFSRPNPMLPLILLFIGFLSSFIGNIAVAGSYNLFFSKKYFQGSKVFALLLLTNGILFFILAPIYLVFSNQIPSLFIILGFHIIFSIFVSACQIEFSANPNYSGSAFMGNILGFALSFLIYSIFYKNGTLGGSENQTYLLMLLPSILGYTLIPFGAGIREKIYFKIYEMGSNPFYLSSTNEKEETEENSTKNNEIEDINIEG